MSCGPIDPRGCRSVLTALALVWLAALLGAFACAKEVSPLPDKNTNWLRACDEDAECGSELACLCGACSQACKSDQQCGDVDPSATCVGSSDQAIEAQCGGTPKPMAGVCSRACDDDRDCEAQGSELACKQGLCAPIARQPACDVATLCAGLRCDEGSEPSATCEPGAALDCRCVAAPRPPERCEPGKLSLERCDDVICPGLNPMAATRCNSDGHWGACACLPDQWSCPGADCARGYACVQSEAGMAMCLETKRCGVIACDPGYECLDGSVCGQTLVEGQAAPTDLIVSGDELVFLNEGTSDAEGNFNFDSAVMAIPLTGGETRRVAMDLNPSVSLTIDGDRAFWLSAGTPNAQQLMTAPLRDGVPVALIGGILPRSRVVARGDYLYWLERPALQPSQLLRARKDGMGMATLLLEVAGDAAALALHADTLYWGDQQLGLWSAKQDGTDASRLSEPLDTLQGPKQLVTDATGVYWIWSGDNEAGIAAYSLTERRTAALDRADGSVSYAALSVALDTTHLYWLYTFRSGSNYYVLQRTGKAGEDNRYLWGTARLTARSRLAVTDDSIYISSPDEGAILRIAKPPVTSE